MLSNVSLLVTDIAYGFFFLLTTAFGIWVYLKSSRKLTHIMFMLLSLAIGVYQVSFIVGTNTPYSDASRIIFQMSLALVFVVAFTVHWIAAVVEREREYKPLIVTSYILAAGLLALYTVLPHAYLLESEPRLYFPNYFVAGNLHFLLILYFVFGFFASMRMLTKSYTTADSIHRNRLAYYMTALCIAYPLGGLSFFLAYGYPIDPILSIPFNFFLAPLAYGVLRYDIMDIKLAARKTFSYALFVIVTAFFIVISNQGDVLLHAAYPDMPMWIIPLLSALFLVLFAGFIWERMRDLEVLKYEFITVVTHKFRTPLTRIKWATEMLKNKLNPSDKATSDERQAVAEIDDADEHLVVLTDMLISLRKANEATYMYEFETADLCRIVEKAVSNMKKHIRDKNLELNLTCPEKSAFVSVDRKRLLFALQIIIENAITYTPQDGKVTISAKETSSDIYINVTDTGIGIAREDIGRVFSKFWRSKEAKVTDTEGMGIGLFMAKEILERHGGDITVSSEGLNKGSTFTLRLPVAKE